MANREVVMAADWSAKQERKPADVVLSGGGVKFVGLVGAVVALMDAGYSFKRVSGVSAGSVVAAILAAASKDDQLTSEEVKDLALSVPLRKWRDAAPVPFLGAAWGLLRDTGMYRGDVAYDWVRSELKNLGVSTFGDLALDQDQLLEGRRYKLVVTVADLTAAQLVRLPWDYRRLYGLDPDEQLVADAVRASMAIPFFYRPVNLTGATGATSTLVDGGVLSNFPIDTFDRPDGKPPRWPTFGITVLPRPTEGIGAVMPALKPLRLFEQTALLESLLTTMLAGHDQTHLNQPWVGSRAITVESTNVGVLDFDISRGRLEELYDTGYAAAQKFLSTWDWPTYLERFRRYDSSCPAPGSPQGEATRQR
jgi:NTE family protein